MNTFLVRLQTATLAAILWLLLSQTPRAQAADANWTGLQPYYTTNIARASNAPPAAGGGGWSVVTTNGLTIAPGSTFWLAFLNSEDLTRRKYFRIEVDTEVADDIACLTRKEGNGFSSTGATVRKSYLKGGFGPAAIRRGGRYDEYVFTPQPAWEHVGFVNDCNHEIKIKVKAWSACALAHPAFNSLQMQSLSFGASGPGVMRTNQRIREVRVFPRNIPANMSVVPAFNAPTNTGRWTAQFETADPSGQPRGVGVRYVTDGAGLAAGQSCGFSFQMQGQRADWQYVLYALDATTGTYQEFNFDLAMALAPQLSLRPSLSGPMLQFDTVPGVNYLLEMSTRFGNGNWTPFRQLNGTGQPAMLPCPTNEPAAFFRVQMLP